MPAKPIKSSGGKSAVDGALSQWMPLGECVTSMWVMPGTVSAGDLLDRCEAMLADARAEHERVKREAA